MRIDQLITFFSQYVIHHVCKVLNIYFIYSILKNYKTFITPDFYQNEIKKLVDK